MLKYKTERGFSIIEILIVLAIAGLIMLVVFLAVPAIRRNVANKGRTADAYRIYTAITDCMGSRNWVISKCDSTNEVDFGQLAELTGTIYFQISNDQSWIDSVVAGDTLGSYQNPYLLRPNADPDATRAIINNGVKCYGDAGGRRVSGNKKDIIVIYNLKTSKDRQLVCIGSTDS